MKADGAHRAMVVLGGNTAYVGRPTYGEHWLGAIVARMGDSSYVGYFQLNEGDVFTTSAGSGRRMVNGGKSYGHIMDASTGKPAENDLGYVTVIERDGARGDALSTALFSMGFDKAVDFLKSHPDIEAFLCMKDGKTAWVIGEFS